MHILTIRVARDNAKCYWLLVTKGHEMRTILEVIATVERGAAITADEARLLERVSRAEEREECAKIADAEIKGPDTEVGKAMDFVARSISTRIRARNN